MQLAKLESAVKTMHSVANDQAAKYRGDMKKVRSSTNFCSHKGGNNGSQF